MTQAQAQAATQQATTTQATATATVELRANMHADRAWSVVFAGHVYPFGNGATDYDDAMAAAARLDSGEDSAREYLADDRFSKVLLPALCRRGCGGLADECQCAAVAAAEQAEQAHAATADVDEDFHNMLARWDEQRAAERVGVSA